MVKALSVEQLLKTFDLNFILFSYKQSYCPETFLITYLYFEQTCLITCLYFEHRFNGDIFKITDIPRNYEAI